MTITIPPDEGKHADYICELVKKLHPKSQHRVYSYIQNIKQAESFYLPLIRPDLEFPRRADTPAEIERILEECKAKNN